MLYIDILIHIHEIALVVIIVCIYLFIPMFDFKKIHISL